MPLLHRPAARAAALLLSGLLSGALSVAAVGALPASPATAATPPSPGTAPVRTVDGTPASDHVFTDGIGDAPKGSLAPRSTKEAAGAAIPGRRAGTVAVTVVTVQLADSAPNAVATLNVEDTKRAVANAGAYWRAMSNGRISMNVTASRTGFVSTAKSTWAWNDIMNTVSRELGWVQKDYTALVIVVPVDQFANGALGYGASSSTSTGGRILMPRQSTLTGNVIAHEFGHTLGLMHADALQCGSGASDTGVNANGSYTDPTCWIREYGDTMDLMGASQFSLPAISSSFWDYGDFGRGDEILDAGVAIGKKTYTLTPWAGTAAKRAVKFTDPKSGEVYYLELRLPVGYDAGTAVGGNRGVKVVQLGGASAASSLILMPDSRPFNGYYSDHHAWQAGQTFTTSAGTTVRIDAIDTASARVTVTAPATPAPVVTPTPAPVVTPTPAPTPTPATPTSPLTAAAVRNGLGAATAQPVTGLRNGGMSQLFQRGTVVWSPATGAHVSKGAVRTKWLNLGAQNGSLGYPLTDEVSDTTGGVSQAYQGGTITWSSATGARVMKGAIGTTWKSFGAQGGSLGYPISDEIGGRTSGGVYQLYQRGMIIWSPATGARVVKGSIRNTWQRLGSENGYLGYPLTDEIGGLRAGGVHQTYQGGTIVYSPTSGARVSRGAIRSAWLARGAENSSLGYPLTDEYRNAAGQTQQDYQGGTITWSSATGTNVRSR